jgi:hypothetical protein
MDEKKRPFPFNREAMVEIRLFPCENKPTSGRIIFLSSRQIPV